MHGILNLLQILAVFCIAAVTTMLARGEQDTRQRWSAVTPKIPFRNVCRVAAAFAAQHPMRRAAYGRSIKLVSGDILTTCNFLLLAFLACCVPCALVFRG